MSTSDIPLVTTLVSPDDNYLLRELIGIEQFDGNPFGTKISMASIRFSESSSAAPPSTTNALSQDKPGKFVEVSLEQNGIWNDLKTR